MSLFNRVCIGLFGICAGVIVLLAMDMVFNSGRFLAHTVHDRTPECSRSCHADTRQDATTAAAVLALPHLQATDRSVDSQTGPWRHPLLGVRLENEGGH